MKKIILPLMLLVFICAANTQSFAEDSAEKTKFKRGVVNTLTGIFEVPKQVVTEVKEAEKGPAKAVSLVGGTVKGVINAVKRTGSGIWDMISFHVNKPINYEPLMKPDYVSERLSEELNLSPETDK